MKRAGLFRHLVSLLLCLLFLALPTGSAYALPFKGAASYTAGTNPIAVAVGDFDRDGDPDLAVANYSSNNISILSGNGSGGFSASANYTTSAQPYSVAAGDFDRDGDPDLAVACSGGTGHVDVFLNNGSGGFAVAVNYAAGDAPSCVAVDDFNRDGRPDLAVANVNSDNISILTGTGTGTFNAAVNYAVGDGPRSVATGDFDLDGIPDLVTANASGGNVSVLLGNGDGTFGAAVNHVAGMGTRSVAMGDFNLDGNPDLATANISGDSVSILLGNGSGGFAAAVNYTTGVNGPTSVTIGDFNRDGRPDVAAATDAGNTVYLLAGNGDGTLAAKVDYAVGSDPRCAAAGDFNRDGNPDLVTANFNGNSVSILLNTAITAGIAFSPAVNYPAGTNPYSIAVGDFDRDGIPDLAVANYGADNITILSGTGSGAFVFADNYTTGTQPCDTAAADFDRDGDLDLATANLGVDSVSVLLNNGDGTFAAKADYAAGDRPRALAAADFDRDGDPDLAVTNNADNDVSILLNNGDGTFAARTDFAVGPVPWPIASADFNRDGIPDLATGNWGNGTGTTVSRLSGNGNGTFAAKADYTVNAGPRSIAVGDFNRDGKPDLAVANIEGGDGNTISILRGNGDGTFAAKADITVSRGPSSVAAGDFNRDGIPDLAVSIMTGNVSILRGNSDGTFAAPVNYAAGSAPIFVATGDFNRDGRSDLAAANYSSHNISILINTLPTGIYGRVGVGVDPPQKILQVSGSGPGSIPLFQRGTDSAGFIIERTSTNRWLFGVNESPTLGYGFVISTIPTGVTSVPRLVISPSGNVTIPGALSAGAKNFRIDHPLHPAGRYLLHSFVESPGMLNVYSGNVVLDANGEAVIELPAYFSALNRDYSYQLDSVGGFAPLYVKQEISDNKFTIAGGSPGLKVSWQISGTRQDPFATAHPTTAEQDKPAGEKGFYMHPIEWGVD